MNRINKGDFEYINYNIQYLYSALYLNQLQGCYTYTQNIYDEDTPQENVPWYINNLPWYITNIPWYIDNIPWYIDMVYFLMGHNNFIYYV